MLSRVPKIIIFGIVTIILLIIQMLSPTKKSLPDDKELRLVVENAYSFYEEFYLGESILTSRYSYKLYIAKNHCIGRSSYFDSFDRPELADIVIRTKHKTFFGLNLSTRYYNCGGTKQEFSRKALEEDLKTKGHVLEPYHEVHNN